MKSEILYLRKWNINDKEALFKYASDPDIGPIAGWLPHESIDDSIFCINNIFNGKECYAICLNGSSEPIGAIELKLNGKTDMTEKDDECELGYWLGKTFWGNGYMTHAASMLISHAFLDLGMNRIWCGYYDGNHKSKRVQEKLGFKYHHSSEIYLPLMNETRIGHVNFLDKEEWEKNVRI